MTSPCSRATGRDSQGRSCWAATWPGGAQFIALGATVTVTGVPGHPTLTVVGFATSVTRSADAWVLPAEIARLRAPGTAASAQLLYRFRGAASAGQVAADADAVSSALPAGAVTGTQSYLDIRAEEASEHRAVRAVRGRLRRHRHGAVGTDRGQRGQRRGDGRLPPDRRPQEHRLHARPDRGRLRRPGHGSRRGRLPGRRGAQQPGAGTAATRPDLVAFGSGRLAACRPGSTSPRPRRCAP